VTKAPKIFSTLANAGLALLIVFLLVRPGGPVGTWWADRTDRIAERAQIREVWETLSATRSLLGTGSPDVIAFTDYQCPFCRESESVLKEAQGEGIAIGVRHLPLARIHPHATSAAIVSACYQFVAPRQHAEVHERLMTFEDWPEGDLPPVDLARQIGEPDARTRACMDSGMGAERVRQDSAAAATLGLRGTPAFVGPNGIVSGVPDLDDLRAIMREP